MTKRKTERQRTASRNGSRTPAVSRNSEQRRNERKQRRLRKKRLRNGLFAVIVVIAAVLASTVFFKVSTMQVNGDTRYTSEELLAASGLSKGDNMAFINTQQIISRLQETFPYLDTVEVSRKLPSTVTITVNDRVPTLSVENDGKYLLMDSTGKVLEETDGASGSTALVLGAKTGGLEVGQSVSEKQEKLQTTLTLMNLMTQYEMNAEVREIDITKAYDVRMKYTDKYTVLLGNMSNLEHRIQFLKAVLQEPTLPESGVIDLTDDSEARYRPSEDAVSDIVVDVSAALVTEQTEDGTETTDGEAADETTDEAGTDTSGTADSTQDAAAADASDNASSDAQEQETTNQTDEEAASQDGTDAAAADTAQAEQ